MDQQADQTLATVHPVAAFRQNPEIEPVYKLAESCLYEAGHAHQVTKLAVALFDELQPLHGLGQHHAFLLICAGLLHDIGWLEGGKGHHKATLRLILQSGLLPWDVRQRLIVGSIARYHRKALPKPTHDHFAALSQADQKDVYTLGGILRVADGLDRTHRSVVRRLTCHADEDSIAIHCYTSRPAEAECIKAQTKGGLLRIAFKRDLEVQWHLQ